MRLSSAQPSTDKGDPGDAVGAEPSPNGARINLGAFGGTADAEPSDPSTATGATGADPIPGADATPPAESPAPGDDGGCSLAGGAASRWPGLLGLTAMALALLRRRRRA